MGKVGAKVHVFENWKCPLTKKHFCHTGICDEYDKDAGECNLYGKIKCSFCENIDSSKQIEDKSEIRKEGFYYIHKAEYVSVAMKNGQERGHSRSRMFPLNFCPECGRKLEDEKNVDI